MTQPTHDEVIAWIDDRIEQIENESPALDPVADWRMIEILKASIASLLANRAGLERHKPIENDPEEEGLPEMCNCRMSAFPCPTYTDFYNPIVSVM